MKKILIISALIYTLIISQLAYAQTDSVTNYPASNKQSKIFISVSAGVDFPNLQSYNKGFGFQLNGGYYISSTIGFRADIQADFINREDEIIHNTDGTTDKVTGRDMDFYTFKADILYGSFDANAIVNPYILIGAGIREKKYSSRVFEHTFFSYFTNSDSTRKSMNEEYRKTDFSAGIGAGITLKLAKKLKISGELQYMMLEGLTTDDKLINGSFALFRAGILILL